MDQLMIEVEFIRTFDEATKFIMRHIPGAENYWPIVHMAVKRAHEIGYIAGKEFEKNRIAGVLGL